MIRDQALNGSGSTLGEVIRVDIGVTGSGYTIVTTITVTTETVDMSDEAKIVDGTDEIVVSGGFYVVKTGDKVTYSTFGWFKYCTNWIY